MYFRAAISIVWFTYLACIVSMELKRSSGAPPCNCDLGGGTDPCFPTAWSLLVNETHRQGRQCTRRCLLQTHSHLIVGQPIDFGDVDTAAGGGGVHVIETFFVLGTAVFSYGLFYALFCTILTLSTIVATLAIIMGGIASSLADIIPELLLVSPRVKNCESLFAMHPILSDVVAVVRFHAFHAAESFCRIGQLAWAPIADMTATFDGPRIVLAVLLSLMCTVSLYTTR